MWMFLYNLWDIYVNICGKLRIFRRSSGDNAVGRGRMWVRTKNVGFPATVSLIALHWKRQGGKLKISIQKTNVREIVNCLHILGNEPYFQLLLFIISDLRKCPCPIRASRKKWKCPIRATFCPIRASRFGVNRPNFAKRNNTSRGEVRKKWEAGWKITRQLQDYYI